MTHRSTLSINRPVLSKLVEDNITDEVVRLEIFSKCKAELDKVYSDNLSQRDQEVLRLKKNLEQRDKRIKKLEEEAKTAIERQTLLSLELQQAGRGEASDLESTNKKLRKRLSDLSAEEKKS